MKTKDIVTVTEAYDESLPGYQDLDADQGTEYALRQTRLTLKQLNKLRRMNDIRKFEKEADLKNVRAQYGPQPEEGSGEVF